MLVNQISHILTLNPNDFKGFSEITIVHPQEIINSANRE